MYPNSVNEYYEEVKNYMDINGIPKDKEYAIVTGHSLGVFILLFITR